jgi:alkylation response protein AidB-like acyl-CoA dehydrogenase
MALRSSESQSIRFTDVFVPVENRIGAPGDFFRLKMNDSFVLGYAAAYLGVAEAAFAFAYEYAASKSFPPDPTPISHEVQVQCRIAEMSALLEAGNLLVKRAAMALEAGTHDERTIAIDQSKYFVGEVALKVTDMALQVVGGRSIFRTAPLERFIRDARAAPVMPPSGDRCLREIGLALFGLSGKH